MKIINWERATLSIPIFQETIIQLHIQLWI